MQFFLKIAKIRPDSEACTLCQNFDLHSLLRIFNLPLWYYVLYHSEGFLRETKGFDSLFSVSIYLFMYIQSNINYKASRIRIWIQTVNCVSISDQQSVLLGQSVHMNVSRYLNVLLRNISSLLRCDIKRNDRTWWN